MRGTLLSLIVSLCLAAATGQKHEQQLEKDEIIAAVNAAATTWTAGRNFDPALGKSYLKKLVNPKGNLKSQLKQQRGSLPVRRLVADDSLELVSLPQEFDAREEWSQCTTIGQVPDEGPCYSAYVIVPTSVFQDRLCISTNGSFNTYLSVQQTMTCCEFCYDDYGCWGGYDQQVWDYLVNVGTCTGGPYKSKVGCQPYTIPECYHDNFDQYKSTRNSMKKCSSYGTSGIIDTPSCKNSCYNKHYGTKFSDDFHQLNSSFTLEPSEKLIKKEIYKSGPLETTLDIYEDFLSYKTGVYSYTTGDYCGSIEVKILGWGVVNGTKYWLAVNSWNDQWGDGGFFKIKRGTNECGFEDNVRGGYV